VRRKPFSEFEISEGAT